MGSVTSPFAFPPSTPPQFNRAATNILRQLPRACRVLAAIKSASVFNGFSGMILSPVMIILNLLLLFPSP